MKHAAASSEEPSPSWLRNMEPFQHFPDKEQVCGLIIDFIYIFYISLEFLFPRLLSYPARLFGITASWTKKKRWQDWNYNHQSKEEQQKAWEERGRPGEGPAAVSAARHWQ